MKRFMPFSSTIRSRRCAVTPPGECGVAELGGRVVAIALRAYYRRALSPRANPLLACNLSSLRAGPVAPWLNGLMIIGERFGWAHLPKTGGTAALWMFRQFPEWAAGHTGSKHSMFAEHEDQIDGKTLVSNIRRLPDWVLSWSHHRAAKDFDPNGMLPPMHSPWEMAEGRRADYWLGVLLDGDRFRVDRWLRMEHLADDFIEFVGEQREVTADQRSRIKKIGAVNAVTYDHDVTHWFSPAQVRRMYAQNPRWEAVEREVYGDIFVLD
jgi:hypothetical protein